MPIRDQPDARGGEYRPDAQDGEYRPDAQDGERQLDDALDIERRLDSYFAANPDDRLTILRGLFAEVLGFDLASGQVELIRARQRSDLTLPDDADRIASLDGVHICHIDLSQTSIDTDRVRKNDVLAAIADIRQGLGDDLLLLVRNRDGDQLHWIHPSLQPGPDPTLRRIVVERDLKQRTVIQQLSNIWWEYREHRDIRAALDRVFDVEPVTKQFFATYKRIFDAAEAMIDGFADHEAEPRRQFVQTLFNRLMFVYFLSRKRWLRLNGETDYLNAIWRAYKQHPTHANFYDDVLHRVFFLGLNSPDSRDLRRGVDFIIGDVPFLNGGLFEQTDLDQRDGIIVPDEAIEPLLTDLFDRFNFTVMESTPFDIEVAVDPEMLGKVFEELVTGRHASGAYYTPRPVVAFMCREALKGYLETNAPQLDPQTIAAFVDRRQTDAIDPVNAPRLATALADVTVVDPACGSGAYLVGMMQELVDLQTALFNVGVDDQSLYQLKLHIIERNLYGADIDPFAVNIAMLRLWLSLAIEFEDDQPEPLPNLDFKIVQGDSLLGPDPSQISLDSHAIRESNLAQYKSQYMRAREPGEKTRLRKRIAVEEDRLRALLADANIHKDAVDWGVQFAEVIGEGGFDIAIANPPYVRQEQIGDTKSLLLKQYKDAATASSDLYCYFYARTLQLLKVGGIHVFICSNSWLDVGYGAKLQKYLLDNAYVRTIYESAVERQFSTAAINTIVSIIQKGRPDSDALTTFLSLRANLEIALSNSAMRRTVTRTQKQLGGGGGKVGDKWGGKYLRAPDIYHHALERCRGRMVRLGDVANAQFGIKTGANSFFHLTPDKIVNFAIEPEFYRPAMTTPRESRSIAINSNTLPKYLFMCHENETRLAGTGALRYIRWGESQGYHMRSSVRSRQRWYDLGDRNAPQLAINKLVDTTARAFLPSSDTLFSDNFHTLTVENDAVLTICAAVNATFTQLQLNVVSRSNFGQGVLEIQTYEVADLLVVSPDLLNSPDISLFESESWDVLTPSVERKEIDRMIYDALGLTTKEREAVYQGVVDLVGNRKRRAKQT